MQNYFSTFLTEESCKPYYKALMSNLEEEYNNHTCFPPKHQIFRAFESCTSAPPKVIIVGQDPYHEPLQANGLAFSCNSLRLPGSLKNILTELASDQKDHSETVMPRLAQKESEMVKSGDLTPWANQGVFLINRTLSVREGKPLSHKTLGWQELSLNAILKLANDEGDRVFILWGSQAGELGHLVHKVNHCVIQSSHPSPLSCRRGFFGSRPFSRANEFLIKCKSDPIRWL